METLDLKPLKMIAQDLEDLQVMVAHLQDAIVPFMSMTYDSETKTFRLLANRFCWEHTAEASEESLHHRVHSGIEIHNVQKVQHNGIDRLEAADRTYNLLTIHRTDEGILHLIFSDGLELRVHVDDLHIRLGDLDHPWPTKYKPEHDTNVTSQEEL